MNDPQDLAAALAKELAVAASSGISVTRNTVAFRSGSSTVFEVQVDISADQVRYRLRSGVWELRGGDTNGTTTRTVNRLDLPNISIYFLNVKVGEFDAIFTTDFALQTARADISGQVNRVPFSYNGPFVAWANTVSTALLAGEPASVAASAAS